MTILPLVPPASSLLWASEAFCGFTVSATLRVIKPSSTCWRSLSSFLKSQLYSETHVAVKFIFLWGSPIKFLTDVNEPLSLTAPIASSFNKAPSAIPSTPLGDILLISLTKFFPLGIIWSAPRSFRSLRSLSFESAITIKPSAFASWIT